MLRRITILAPLQHRNYRFLFGGEVVSDLGDWLDLLAVITLIVYRWKLGPGALAGFSMALIAPRVLLAPLAGVWVDRWPRRTIMIVADLARVPIVLAMVVAHNLETLLALVAIKGALGTFFGPAWMATIRGTVPEEDLLAANSLSQLSLQMTRVLGPAVGGVLVAVAGPRSAFVADAVSFLLSATFLSRLPLVAPTPQPVAGPKPSFWEEFRAGFVYILRRRVLAVSVGTMAAAMFIIFTFDGLGALAIKALGVRESLLGLAVGAIGLGTAAGAAVIGQWGMRFHPLKIMGVGEVASGAMVAVVGIAVIASFDRVPAAWIPGWLIVGLSGAAMFVPYGYVLQRETPEELMGRVSASATAVGTTFQLLAPPLGALIAAWLGVGFVFAAAGVVLIVIGVGVLLMGVPAETGPGAGAVDADPNLEASPA